MEEPKTKQEKNGMVIKLPASAGCACGIGGIVILGGALVATLVSAFVFKRRAIKTEQGKSSSDSEDVTVHQSPPPAETVNDDQTNDLEMMMKSSKNHHNQITKGLTVLIPDDSSLPFLPNNSRNEDEHLSTENPSLLGEGVKLLLEEDESFDVACDGIGVRDDDETEKEVEEVYDVEVIKECDDVQDDNESRYLEDADEVVKGLAKGEKDNESRCLITVEEFSKPIVDGISLILDSGKVPPSIGAEKIPQVESSDSKESDDNNEERSDQGTEDLSTESNYDSVWPAESTQELSFKLNERETNNQITGGGNPRDNDDNIDKADEKVETIGSYVNQRSIETWTWLMLAILWCLCQWYLGLPFLKVSILTMVISIVVLFGCPNHVLAKHK